MFFKTVAIIVIIFSFSLLLTPLYNNNKQLIRRYLHIDSGNRKKAPFNTYNKSRKNHPGTLSRKQKL